MTAPEAFNLLSVQTICSDWPNSPVPDLSVADGVLERLRQVLRDLQHGIHRGHADLVPLIRQVLLRHASGDTAPGWLRVPTALGWPNEQAWRCLLYTSRCV